MQYNGQSLQDMFVLLCSNRKTNGTFVEIGTNHPIRYNNTYILENQFNWSGFLVEFLPEFSELYKTIRPKSYAIIKDATQINFLEEFEKVSFPKNIDYLQIDLDADDRTTLTTLENLDATVMETYKFATITFEHDIYTGDFFDTRNISRSIFANRGYIRVFSDICAPSPYGEYEDWYVHPNLVDMNFINRIITDTPSLTPNDIATILKKEYELYYNVKL